MLELVLKWYASGPPLIGIVYPSEDIASRMHQSYPNTYYSHWYKMKIQPIGDKIKLEVTMNMGMNWYYEIDKFDLEKLKRFVAITKSYSQINFGHIKMVNDKAIPVKTSVTGRPWLLGVKSIELMPQKLRVEF